MIAKFLQFLPWFWCMHFHEPKNSLEGRRFWKNLKLTLRWKLSFFNWWGQDVSQRYELCLHPQRIPFNGIITTITHRPGGSGHCVFCVSGWNGREITNRTSEPRAGSSAIIWNVDGQVLFSFLVRARKIKHDPRGAWIERSTVWSLDHVGGETADQVKTISPLLSVVESNTIEKFFSLQFGELWTFAFTVAFSVGKGMGSKDVSLFPYLEKFTTLCAGNNYFQVTHFFLRQQLLQNFSNSSENIANSVRTRECAILQFSWQSRNFNSCFLKKVIELPSTWLRESLVLKCPLTFWAVTERMHTHSHSRVPPASATFNPCMAYLPTQQQSTHLQANIERAPSEVSKLFEGRPLQQERYAPHQGKKARFGKIDMKLSQCKM